MLLYFRNYITLGIIQVEERLDRIFFFWGKLEVDGDDTFTLLIGSFCFFSWDFYLIVLKYYCTIDIIELIE